ncbi:MAG: ECF-type sigma factor [Thermoanaerobaculia bacterium]
MPTEPLESLLERARGGDARAFDEAYAAVYQEIRRVARWQRRQRNAGETLSTTALVHEAYVKLAGPVRLGLQNHHHLIALAARAMRQILVDAARARLAAKRGGGAAAVELEEEAFATPALAEELVALDRALERLAARDERLARLVEWRYFGGMTDGELARALERDERTIRRDWQKARAFLIRELGGEVAGLA